MTFWQNAINSTNNSILECKDYKDVIIGILDDELVAAADDDASSNDNNVILVSVLYSDISAPFDPNVVKDTRNKIDKEEKDGFKYIEVHSRLHNEAHGVHIHPSSRARL